MELGNGRGLHADIVVEVTSSYAETIGGNLGHSDPVAGNPCKMSKGDEPFAVRRRRYRLNDDGDGKLFVSKEKIFVQEDDGGNISSAWPLDCTDSTGLHDASMGRVFTILRPVELALKRNQATKDLVWRITSRARTCMTTTP